jgi:Uma2 family endonuclease
MLGPLAHLVDVREYYRLAETGALRPDRRTELLHGKIIDMSPIGPFHSTVVNRITRLLNLNAGDRWIVSSQNPIHLDDHSEPQPDLTLLKPSSDEYASGHARPEDVLLLVEISDSSLDYDREEKLPCYGRAGIAGVWIVNLNNRTLEVYREPHFNGYGAKTILHPGDQAAPQAFPDAIVAVAELLKR